MNVVDGLNQRPYNARLTAKPHRRAEGLFGIFAAIVDFLERRRDAGNVRLEEVGIVRRLILPVGARRKNAGDTETWITVVQARDVGVVQSLLRIVLRAIEEEPEEQIGLAESPGGARNR